MSDDCSDGEVDEAADAVYESADEEFVAAVRKLDVDAMRGALQRGANARALVTSEEFGEVRAVEYIACGCRQYDDSDDDGYSCDSHATERREADRRQRRLQALRLLRSYGGFGDAAETTELLWAAKSRCGAASIKLFLQCGADARYVDPESGDTFLHHAWRTKRMRLFAAAGADVNRANAAGTAPIHLWVHAIHDPWAVLSMLVTAGANVDARDGDGNTPLQAAIARWSRHHDMESTVWALLQLGADPTVLAGDGLDVIDCALDRLRHEATMRYSKPPLHVRGILTMLAAARCWWRRRHMLLAIRGRAASA